MNRVNRQLSGERIPQKSFLFLDNLLGDDIEVRFFCISFNYRSLDESYHEVRDNTRQEKIEGRLNIQQKEAVDTMPCVHTI